ncbi:lycopene cyclase domain-containing protein [Krasilnikoviella flava]|uniref:Lycopene cyclase domain-containing protein n=1 Tax=Krasilnikoviella flava TaxID=526729 RepID=A0A1T5LYS0_9MICO|nr:lycopene cyclase domain-containing protein [Krasilnikoviella flava]SKC81023.1 lycopene cyclase domain-containing protein [Krasilnikoviella flava]
MIALHWNSFVYLALLLGALASMALVDRRARLVLWSATPLRGAVVLAVGTLAFLGWDLVAIAAGFYSRGGAAMTGIELAPHLPLEELFFVLFLCWFTLLLHGLLRRVLARREGARRRPARRGALHAVPDLPGEGR